MKIRIAITGRSYHEADSLPDHLTLPDDATLEDALCAVAELLDDALPSSCLVSISGRHVGTVASHDNQPLSDGDELLLVAPVAGG